MTDHDHGPYMEREFKKAAIRRAQLDLELDERIEEFCKPISLSIKRAERTSRQLDTETEERVKLKYPMTEPKRQRGIYATFKKELSGGWTSFNIIGKIVFVPLIFVVSCLTAIGFDKLIDKLFFKDLNV